MSLALTAEGIKIGLGHILFFNFSVFVLVFLLNNRRAYIKLGIANLRPVPYVNGGKIRGLSRASNVMLIFLRP